MLKEVLHSSIKDQVAAKKEQQLQHKAGRQQPSGEQEEGDTDDAMQQDEEDEEGRSASQLELSFRDIMGGLQERAGGGAAAGGGKAGGGEGGAEAEAAAGGPLKDLSVHLCFICLLHLANEHGLQLTNHGQLDVLSVLSSS